MITRLEDPPEPTVAPQEYGGVLLLLAGACLAGLLALLMRAVV